MKRFFYVLFFVLFFVQVRAQSSTQDPNTPLSNDSFYWLAPASVRAVRAGENSPFTRTNLNKKEIRLLNQGMDIPFLLNQTPSVVANADAGNGIGYTGIRIRGTDATRINITLNGIPFNDAESQGTFFVNLPDFSSSTASMQIQRGVGTSSNGTGAFGASINMSTNENRPVEFAELSNSVGSFGTHKHTLQFGTGPVKGFSTQVRLSSILSSGYIDRASSNLRSFYISSTYEKDSTVLRLNVFSGKEKTYQAWYGISQADLDAGNRTINYAGTEKPGEPYKNETDNYWQTHYQLFLEKPLSHKIRFNTAFFLVRGKGYYEQYKADEPYSKYGLAEPILNGSPVSHSDFIRQLWLNNYFFGNNFHFTRQTPTSQFTFGGSLTKYLGKHYGDLIWAANGMTGNSRWYHLTAHKKDQNIYFKQQTEFRKHWYIFYDLQYRQVRYVLNGFRDNPNIFLKNKYQFFNPKAGLTYHANPWRAYLSFSKGSKEPNRDDFEAGTTQLPRPEKLYDLESGLEYIGKKYSWGITGYFMSYKDQLVLTGKINDVGAYTRTNVAQSYRLGLELQGTYQFNSWIDLAGNLAISENRVKNVEEFIDDYDNGGQQQKRYPSSTLSYSPSVVGGATLNLHTGKNLTLSFPLKYVSSQFLDNTANRARMLDAFIVQDLKIDYTRNCKWVKEYHLFAQFNNLFNAAYEPNGYTFSYIYGGQLNTENYYFPMAGINFSLGLTLRW